MHESLARNPTGLLKQLPERPNRLPFDKTEINGSIAARLETIVAAQPDWPAVIDGSATFTYRQINQHANRITHTVLNAQKNEPDQERAVALFFDHGAGGISAMLGILKAGGFFIPIEPNLPDDRIRFLLDDSDAKIILTDSKNHPRIRDLAERKLTIINIDLLENDIPLSNPNLKLNPNSISNLVYTSGSMGQPKGVIYAHKNLLHASWRGGNHYALTPEDRVSLTFSFGFGGSMLYLFGTLLNGATLYPFDIKKKGLKLLINWLQAQKITFYQATPTTLRQIAPMLTPTDSFPDLRLLLLGGEPIRESDFMIFKKYFSPQTYLRLGGGTTEAVLVAECFLSANTPLPAEGIPMGYIIPDKKVIICAEDRQTVEPGETGEIVIQSQYLSKGYWKDPQLTKEKFLPASGNSQSQWYLTGDLGLFSPAGILFHRGRKDHQIKVRGYRIELGEIETVLLANPNVTEAVVDGRTDHHGEIRLVAYVVAKTSITQLRQWLAKKLPDYMIPAYFMLLEKIPLTSSLKVNRQALPDPGTDRPEIDTIFVPPRTDLEAGLVKIWEEILGIHPIGIHDSFFALGGHSLYAAQIVNRIHQSRSVEVSMSMLMTAPTIAQLATLIEAGAAPPADDNKPLIRGRKNHPDADH